MEMEKEYKIIKPQTFEIVGANKFEGVPTAFSVGGANKYFRILIKPTIKDEDRDYEVVDEDEKIIYQVPFWMVSSIIERIEYERMTKDWVKTIKFDDRQQDILRILELVLLKQNEMELYSLINDNRLSNKVPEAYDFETLYNKAMKVIDQDILDKELDRLRPIYKMRNEIDKLNVRIKQDS